MLKPLTNNLSVRKLRLGATLPTVAHPGSDAAYDVYALMRATLEPGTVVKVGTGIAAQYSTRYLTYGLLLQDRSSMGARGIKVLGGVIDHGYTGEIVVMLINHGKEPYEIKAGDKIAQMIPIEILTSAPVVEVEDLGASDRGSNGFGSSGR